MHCIAVIPARLDSTRFPGKLLAAVAGKPLIQQVVEGVLRVPGIDRTVVATDDDGIAAAARNGGVDVVLCRGDFASGTDRVAAAVAGSEADIVVNVQGDELVLDAAGVGAAIERFRASEYPLGTLRAPLSERQDLWDPNVVKVVVDSTGRAMYFSRAPLPFPRAEWQRLARPESAAPRPLSEWIAGVGAAPDPYPSWAHLGVYLYRPPALRRWAALPPSRLELSEGLEQLRALEAGEHMQTYLINEFAPSVNTPADLKKAGAALAARA